MIKICYRKEAKWAHSSGDLSVSSLLMKRNSSPYNYAVVRLCFRTTLKPMWHCLYDTGNLPGRCSFYECKIHNTPELPLLIRDTIVAKNSLGKMGKTEKNLLLHLLWEFLTCWIVTFLCSRYLTRKRNYWKKYNIPYEELSLIFGGASKFVFKVG